MSGPTYQSELEAQLDLDVGQQPHPVGAKSADAAWAAIETILAGQGNAADLVGLVTQLDDAHKEKLSEKIEAIGKLSSGNDTLEIGTMLGSPVKAVMVAAIRDARAQPTTQRLQRYLAQATSADLGSLDEAMIVHLRKVFGEHPLLTLFPKASLTPYYLADQTALLRWFIETTPPAVVATMMGNGGSDKLGRQLDELKLWKPWIDHVQVALPSYDYLASGTKDPEIRHKLLAPFGARAHEGADGSVHTDGGTSDAGAALEGALATDASKQRLIEAINAAGTIAPGHASEVIRALRRVRASADEVLALTQIAADPGIAWLQLLLDAPGVSVFHVMTYVGQNPIEVTELTEPVIRLLRARTGKALHLYQLGRKKDNASHQTIVETETLRQWFLEDALPADLLWFCSQEGELATKATRIVAARYPDWAWVHQLTGAEDQVHLRALALNCHDSKAEKFIREELLRDSKGIATFHHEETSPKVYTGERERLDLAVALSDSAAVMARLADLDDAERTAFGRSPTKVADLVSKGNLSETEFARAAHLAGMSYSIALTYCPAGLTILTHLRTRPGAEESTALAQGAVVEAAASKVSPDLFLVFPSLANRAVLANAIAANPNVLGLLLTGSNANRVLDLIATEPAMSPAIATLFEDRTMTRLLPPYEQMSAAGRAFVDKLGHTPHLSRKEAATIEDIKTSDVDDRANSSDPEEKRAVERASAAHDLEGMESLPAALDKLLTEPARITPSAITNLLTSRAQEVPALLSDPAQWVRVATIAHRLQVPPSIACPFIAAELLVGMPNSLRWYFELYDRTALLHLVDRPGVASIVSQHLGADMFGAREWLRKLPRGAALTADERRLVDMIENTTTVTEVIRALFETRFDIQPPPPSGAVAQNQAVGRGYSAGEIDSLYRIASRLPPSHVDQKRIRMIAAGSVDIQGADGLWDGRDVKIGSDEAEGKSSSMFHDDALEKEPKPNPDSAKSTDGGKATPKTAANDRQGTPSQGWLRIDEVKRAFGYDDEVIAARVKAGDIEVLDQDGMQLYKVTPVKVDTFTQIVLHEIGHSVDDMLGRHTSAVYEFAGWHEFNDEQFDAWAGEMGGWERVSPPDKAKIREAWIDAARAKRGVHDLVSKDHPAMSDTYADVGIVKMGREGKSFSAWNRDIVNGRMFVAGSYPGQWYSLNAAIVPSAPSYYSLYAPAEYFAESYVEYYRGVDGSPGSEKKKGGALAAPVKQFFDQRVDSLKYDPRRFDGKSEET